MGVVLIWKGICRSNSINSSSFFEDKLTGRESMNHKDLDLWNVSVGIAVEIIQLTEELPKTLKFSLSDQMQRAAISISSNVAEGAARGSSREFIRYLNIASGSASELHTHLTILKKLDLVPNEMIGSIQTSLEGVSKMIQGLKKSLKRKLTENKSK